MISEGRVERAVEYIRDNAEALGKLIGQCKALEQTRKVVRGHEFIQAKGTVAEREATAESSAAFIEVVNDIENAWAEKSTLETKLKAAELTIEVWRSQNSAKNRGHL